VTVNDSFKKKDNINSIESVQDRGETNGPEDHRGIATLMAEQIEFADVIMLNKTDLVDEKKLKALEGTVRALNPGAIVYRTEKSKIGLDKVLGTGLFDFEKASLNPGWLKTLRGEESKESEEYGVSSFVYRARRPFHPKRLHDLLALDTPIKGVVRSKGFCWIASHDEFGGMWASCGRLYNVEPDHRWYVTVPRDQWEVPEEDVLEDFNKEEPELGDKRQEIVIIGVEFDKEAAKKNAGCLSAH